MTWLARTLFLLALAPTAALAQAPAWTVLPESIVGFTAQQGGAPVDGLFDSFTAEIQFDAAALDQSRVEVTIDIASVNSQSKDRDDTIRSANLFDAAQWPSARFAAESFTKTGDGQYQAEGTLTLRDVTHDVSLPFMLVVEQDPVAPDRWRARAHGELEVMRLDYGVGQGLWKDTSVVANEVVIRIDIVAWRPKE